MKRILLLVTLLSLIASFSFAQKGAVKNAKASLRDSNFPEARDYIKPALENPETANDPETWKVAGDIEYSLFDGERTKEIEKLITKKGADFANMYAGLYNMYAPYVKADELAEKPDSKGKVKNKVRNDIVKKFRSAYSFYINAGTYHFDNKNFKAASELFEMYWDIPTLPMFVAEKTPLINESDTANTYHMMKYYACISAVQAEDHPRAIKLINRLIDEGYAPNEAYKESDPFELLAAEYKAVNDSLGHANTLAKAATLFPNNVFFTSNLINEYIRAGNVEGALSYLDQAIANDPNNACDLLNVKAALLANQKEFDKAEPVYKEAIAANDNCEKAYEGLGVLYVLKAQEIKEVASQTTNRQEQAELDEKTIALYLQSLPYLEKHRDFLKVRSADKGDLLNSLGNLQNVYYNLSILKVDKSKELEAVDAEIEALKK